MDNNAWQVNIHTADGWITYGTYATYRGAMQALRLSRRKVEETPQCSRVGGTDTTVSVVARVDDDYYNWRFVQSTRQLQGCQMPYRAWSLREFMRANAKH